MSALDLYGAWFDPTLPGIPIDYIGAPGEILHENRNTQFFSAFKIMFQPTVYIDEVKGIFSNIDFLENVIAFKPGITYPNWSAVEMNDIYTLIIGEIIDGLNFPLTSLTVNGGIVSVIDSPVFI